MLESEKEEEGRWRIRRGGPEGEDDQKKRQAMSERMTNGNSNAGKDEL